MCVRAVVWVLDLVISQSASVVVVLKSGCECVLCVDHVSLSVLNMLGLRRVLNLPGVQY